MFPFFRPIVDHHQVNKIVLSIPALHFINRLTLLIAFRQDIIVVVIVTTNFTSKCE